MIKKYLYRFCMVAVASAAIFFAGCSLGPSEGAFLRVDSQQCVGCRECVRVCNADAIVIISNKAVIDLTKCVECLKCVEACPYDAIE